MLFKARFLRYLISIPASPADRVLRRIIQAIESVLAEAVVATGAGVITQAVLDFYTDNLLANAFIALAVMAMLSALFLIVDVKVVYRWIKKGFGQPVANQ